MSRRTQLLLVLVVTPILNAGCSSDSWLRLPEISGREAVIRDRLWSESALVRGASPDEKIVILSPNDTIDTTGTQAETRLASAEGTDPAARSESTELPNPQCCTPLNWRDDCNCLVPEFCRDVDAILNCHDLGILFVAGGVSYLFHETLDDDVAESYERHPNRWGKGQEFFAGIGNPGHQFGAVGALYLYSLHTQDEEIHDLSKSLFNALAITGLSTMALKATIGSNTTAPNEEPDPFGGAWPSGHTSSSFAFAAVLDEYYGPKVGIPAYILAGLVGWERLDDGEHDLSDVVFGAVLGYVIGKTVAAEHHCRFCGMEMQPLVDPASGTTGLCFERHF